VHADRLVRPLLLIVRGRRRVCPPRRVQRHRRLLYRPGSHNVTLSFLDNFSDMLERLSVSSVPRMIAGRILHAAAGARELKLSASRSCDPHPLAMQELAALSVCA